MSKRKKWIIGIVAFFVLGGAADAFFLTQTPTGRSMLADFGISFERQEVVGYLASGLIEAVDVSVSSELGGRVVEVLAAEGDAVEAGQVLLTLDTAMLERQLEQARGVLTSAQANYDLLVAGATDDELAVAQANLTAAQLELLVAQQAYDDLFEQDALIRAEARAAVAQAEDDLDTAQRRLRGTTNPDIEWYQDQVDDARDALATARENAERTEILQAETALHQAQENFDDFEEYYLIVKSEIENCDTSDPDRNCDPNRRVPVRTGLAFTLADAEENYNDALNMLRSAEIALEQARRNDENAIEDAEKFLEDALEDLDWALGDPNVIDLALAEANVAVAEAALADAQTQWEDVRDGPDPDALALVERQLAAAEANLAAAEAQLERVETGPRVERLTAALGQLEAAQATVDLLEWQISQQTITAPSDGVVLTRLVEPGEIVSPGAPLLIIGQLDNLTITVYVPENRYGSIMLGQSAALTVDSFPGETFSVTVKRIADQAEFTPRNVQTAEERVKTVFAVELAIEDDSGRLKPGMPADALFGS